MEKVVESYDKENMRMAMLKHEETFRQQVYELHRLYRIQKVLMKNIGENECRSRDRWNIKNEVFLRQKELDLEQPAAEDQIMEESEIELTLGPSSYNQRRKKAETKLTSDSGPSFSSSSTGSSQGNKVFSEQITRNNYREVREQFIGGPEMGLVGFLESNNSGYQRGNVNSSSSSVDVEEEMRLRQHPWLYQVVSLNLT